MFPTSSQAKNTRQGGLRDAFMNVNIEVYWLHTRKGACTVLQNKPLDSKPHDVPKMVEAV